MAAAVHGLPDIAEAVALLERFAAVPANPHVEEAERFAGYTERFGLTSPAHTG